MFARHARALAFHLEEGQEVVVEGDVVVYGPRGTYELVVKTVEPPGLGAQYLALIQLRARLGAEGVFSPGAKRPLPPFPTAVGVVTSEHGAALVDVLLVLGDRWPMAGVIVAPARVQGEGAAESIVTALGLLGRHGGVDVVLLGRGGGSGEDLLAFNDEIVVRAIRTCPVPVVSCVGHEVDWTLTDLAADARAPTPTAGAALVVPDREEVSLQLHRTATAMAEGMRRSFIASEGNLRGQARLLTAGPLEEMLAQRRRTRATARTGLEGGAATWLKMAVEHLGAQGALLEASGPPATLARGYAIALRGADRQPLASVSGIDPGEELTILLVDGEVTCRVVGVRPRVT
jgi:exodeoxyribonuclease VII large subunit